VKAAAGVTTPTPIFLHARAIVSLYRGEVAARRDLRAEAITVSRTLARAWHRLGSGSGRLAGLAVLGSIIQSAAVIPLAYLLRHIVDVAIPQRRTTDHPHDHARPRCRGDR
jgi:hypothetical protein